MNTSLDDRARRAVDGLNRAVQGVSVDGARIPGAPKPRSMAPAWSMVAGAVAAAGVIGGLALIRSPEVVAPVSEVVPTTTPIVTEPAPAPTTTDLPGSPPVEIAPVPTEPPADLDPPIIEITFPQPGYVSETKNITFEGITEPGARVHAGPYEATVDPSGAWRITLILSEGSTTATFVAEDRAGNTARASVTVGYEKPVVTTTTTEKPVAKFTANATYGSCELDPPYDVYYGTGQPGAKIKVTSEYGSGSTVVNEGGGWELRVEFPTAPKGVPFLVTVTDGLGGSKTFEFVAIGGA